MMNLANNVQKILCVTDNKGGKPYYLGGSAYDPETGEECRINHYGGYVCSENCDATVCLKVLRSMPGCDDAAIPDPDAAKTLKQNWEAKNENW